MRFELLEAVVKKPPPKVKFSWLLGGFVKTFPWKTHLGVVVLEPPPKKNVLRVECLEMVVKNEPPHVKLSWHLGRIVKKPPWKIHLGVIVLEPPKKSWKFNF